MYNRIIIMNKCPNFGIEDKKKRALFHKESQNFKIYNNSPQVCFHFIRFTN